MGCGGSRADAIEPRYYESWTRETESTWLTNTDSESPPQEGSAEGPGREQSGPRPGECGRGGRAPGRGAAAARGVCLYTRCVCLCIRGGCLYTRCVCTCTRGVCASTQGVCARAHAVCAFTHAVYTATLAVGALTHAVCAPTHPLCALTHAVCAPIHARCVCPGDVRPSTPFPAVRGTHSAPPAPLRNAGAQGCSEAAAARSAGSACPARQQSRDRAESGPGSARSGPAALRARGYQSWLGLQRSISSRRCLATSESI